MMADRTPPAPGGATRRREYPPQTAPTAANADAAPSRRWRKAPGLGAPKLVVLWRRLFFTKAVRADAWQLLADILAGGSQDSATLEAMAMAYRAQGKRVIETVLIDLREAIPRDRLQERFADYCGPSERIILAGYGKVDAARVMASAARLLRMELAIAAAIRKQLALPALYTAGLVGIFFLFGLRLYPAVEQIVDFAELPAFHRHVIAIVSGFTQRPWIPALAGGVVAAIVAWALPNWKGPGRTIADRVFPFSLARMMAGASFLFSVIEYGRSGQQVTTRLYRQMARAGSPYSASRISAIADCYVAAGANLGTASIKAGHGFPAIELGAILQMLWNEENGIDRAAAFTDRWLAGIEERLKARMLIVNGVLLSLIAATLIVLMSVALPILTLITGDLYS